MQSLYHNIPEYRARRKKLSLKADSYTKKLIALEKKNDYSLHESALFVPHDVTYLKNVKKVATKLGRVEHVVLVGIGGSSLGTEAVYSALAYKTSPSLLVLDSVDEGGRERLKELLTRVRHKKSIALVVVSKSGTTTETMANGVMALTLCEEKFGESFSSQVVFIGDKGTPFFKIGKKKRVAFLPVPESVGGRYSVFTAVGILPLFLLNIDITSLLEGARAAALKPALLKHKEAAIELALLAEHGVHTVNFFTFTRRLGTLGLWYRQLLAESIGKNMTTKGTSFQYQLLPIVSQSVDLHSMAQLFLGGYKGVYTHFVYAEENHPFHLLTKHWLLDHVPFLGGKTSHDVTEAIVHGVKRAYDDQNLPYRYSHMEKCSAYEIGYFLSSCMAEVMYTGHLLNVNPFDQPSVEYYKKHTRVKLDR